MPRNNPNPIDSHIGNRIRKRRLMLDMRREELAEALELTAEQMEQAEEGTYRLTASDLTALATLLRVKTPAYFFENAPDHPQSED